MAAPARMETANVISLGRALSARWMPGISLWEHGEEPKNCAGGSGPEQVTFSIAKSAAVPTRIIIADDFYGELTSSNAFTIPSQTADISGLPVTVNGNGSLNGNQINMTLVFAISNSSTTCTITANKQ